MPNLREIARATGLTATAVSMALRNAPGVSEATRRRVREIAEKMGYRPNPLVTSLMQHIRSGRETKEHGCIAILVNRESKEDWLSRPSDAAFRQHYEGYQRQATLRGYRTECFFLKAPGMSAEIIDRRLYSRGIAGMILAAPRGGALSSTHAMHWERYALSTISYSWITPPIDRISSHHRHTVERAYTEVYRRGYRRIGLCLPEVAINGVDSNWMAGYLVSQIRIPGAVRIPPFAGNVHETPLKTFRVWHDRWRPDVLLTLLGEEEQWTRALGLAIPDDLALVCLNRPPDSSLAGIDENNVVVGATACDLVVNQLTHNERGPPSHPKTILIDGNWHDGWSLPSEKKKSRRPRPLNRP
ncbi:LacI family transcriptional regulator [Opitutaceae bacterium TAV4]|nr:LacI family transcriptional regulator [Opitutaceae bacterium TAV4]RRK01958.1 LacI family transcriptional regulator [Opitutaceae bacterium TAV3]